jgi:hypothetical protein
MRWGTESAPQCSTHPSTLNDLQRDDDLATHAILYACKLGSHSGEHGTGATRLLRALAVGATTVADRAPRPEGSQPQRVRPRRLGQLAPPAMVAVDSWATPRVPSWSSLPAPAAGTGAPQSKRQSVTSCQRSVACAITKHAVCWKAKKPLPVLLFCRSWIHARYSWPRACEQKRVGAAERSPLAGVRRGAPSARTPAWAAACSAAALPRRRAGRCSANEVRSPRRASCTRGTCSLLLSTWVRRLR